MGELRRRTHAARQSGFIAQTGPGTLFINFSRRISFADRLSFVGGRHRRGEFRWASMRCLTASSELQSLSSSSDSCIASTTALRSELRQTAAPVCRRITAETWSSHATCRFESTRVVFWKTGLLRFMPSGSSATFPGLSDSGSGGPTSAGFTRSKQRPEEPAECADCQQSCALVRTVHSFLPVALIHLACAKGLADLLRG